MNRRSANALRVAGLCAVSLLLAACLAHRPAPVSERSPVDGPLPDVYTVQRYDTLYSVAWRYELDVDDLAVRNGIKPPYVIKTGQRIALTGTGPPPNPAPPRAEPPPPTQPATADRRVETGETVAAKPPPTPVPDSVAKPAAAPEPAAKPPDPPTTKPAPPPSAKPQPAAAPAKAAVPDPAPPRTAQPSMPTTVASGAWRRPVAAKPTRGFGGGSKGLDYSLRQGTLIQAATSGVVVYAGPGLGGFRHLVIVKASDRHLVAYGVNVRPNLAEGDTVRMGDGVARAGSGATGGKFHFEVRDRGKPIDPNSLLGG